MRAQGEDRLRDLVAIEPLVVLNAGFCERHLVHCPPSAQLTSACAQASTSPSKEQTTRLRIVWC